MQVKKRHCVQTSFQHLLPPGSKQHEVLLFGSIYEGILQARHYLVQIDKKNTKILV